MEFRIADTFTDSLAKLTGDEQKSVKTAAFDLQLNPAHPSLQFHRLDKPKDRRFWSIRVSSDVRLIVHRTDTSLLLCYVGHHDNAYQWAERRKLETHPKTGAAQFVEVRETVQEIVIPKYVEVEQPHVAKVAAPKPLLGLPASRKTSCWGTASPPNGWPMSAAPMRIRCSNWRITCRARLPRRSWIWRPASHQKSRSP
jgi:mRNA-degrading endonuclease RelE of RelBE toxin-antitoxin system